MRITAAVLLSVIAGSAAVAEDPTRSVQRFAVVVVPRLSVTRDDEELKIQANVALSVEIDRLRSKKHNTVSHADSDRVVRFVPATPFATLRFTTSGTKDSSTRVLTISSLH